MFAELCAAPPPPCRWQSLEEDPKITSFCRRKALCRTLANNRCDLLTVTATASDLEDLRQRKGVVITARVHPSETVASWMMEVGYACLVGLGACVSL